MKPWKFPARAAALSLAGLLCAAAAAPAPPKSSQQQVEHTFDRSVPLPAGQSVRIEHKFGGISVTTHASRDVHVLATIRVSVLTIGSRGICQQDPDSSRTGLKWGFYSHGLSRARQLLLAGKAKFLFQRRISNRSPRRCSPHGAQQFWQRESRGIESRHGHRQQGSVNVHDGRGLQLLRDSFGSIELIGNDGDADLSTNNGSITASQVRRSHGTRPLRQCYGVEYLERRDDHLRQWLRRSTDSRWLHEYHKLLRLRSRLGHHRRPQCS